VNVRFGVSVCYCTQIKRGEQRRYSQSNKQGSWRVPGSVVKHHRYPSEYGSRQKLCASSTFLSGNCESENFSWSWGVVSFQYWQDLPVYVSLCFPSYDEMVEKHLSDAVSKADLYAVNLNVKIRNYNHLSYI
jgi:hypothetical protein